MKEQTFTWTLSHSKQLSGERLDTIPANVPGAVQLDYAQAFSYPPYYFGLNFQRFAWMEDEYFHYQTELEFSCKEEEQAWLCVHNIDYRYQITVDGEIIAQGEGIFTPVFVDITRFSGQKSALCVTVFPIPKRFNEQDRTQASASCKPPSSYGWDWHPRLVPMGIFGKAYLKIVKKGDLLDTEIATFVEKTYDKASVQIQAKLYEKGLVQAELYAPNGDKVATSEQSVDGEGNLELTVENPLLWYPRGYGEQPLYTLKITAGEVVKTQRIGFRRVRLALSEGQRDANTNVTLNVGAAEHFESGYPMGPIGAPTTLVINGKRVFAKGSNWVNADIFPTLTTKERYDKLLGLVYDANMNILRLWGGQYIPDDCFYEKCDELGIMVWQEFMLSCNDYPDEEEYLQVLEQEATSIIKRLRIHPCLALWCGGNELFNSWSGMTVQSHAVRLLDSLCYRYDRQTPFNMTSPLHGMGHGGYMKLLRSGDKEFLESLKQSSCTAYTEFGCNGGATKEYLLRYVMEEKDFADCNENNAVWQAHHAFKAWMEYSWLGVDEVQYYFGSYSDTEDLLEKSLYLQDMAYKSMFEEMRRHAPFCAMAINWDFNEPWPCAAGNSLVNWLAEAKTCLQSVKESLRSTLLSLETARNRYLTGETLEGRVWLLNDSDNVAKGGEVCVYLCRGDEKTLLLKTEIGDVEARSNSAFQGFSLQIDESIPQKFSILLEFANDKERDSLYTFVHRLEA